jgi:hypothetical protein
MMGFNLLALRRSRRLASPTQAGAPFFSRKLSGGEINVLCVAREELESTALLVAVGVSVLQWRLQLDSKEFALGSAANLPDRPLLFSSIVRDLAAIDMRGDFLRSLQRFYSGLDLVRAQSAMWCRLDNDSIRAQRQSYDTWAKLASLAVVALHEWDQFVEDLAERRLQHRDRTVFDILLRVRNGEMPCIAADGSIQIPGWLERGARRDVMNVVVKVTCGDVTTPAVLRDLSSSGLGLQGYLGLDVGERFSVALPDGRTMLCEAVWATGDRTGARFIASGADGLCRTA